MKLAHKVASATLPDFRSPFSRHDFTLAQLFACLVVREHLRLSYRRTEAMLHDTDWCARLGMARVPGEKRGQSPLLLHYFSFTSLSPLLLKNGCH